MKTNFEIEDIKIGVTIVNCNYHPAIVMSLPDEDDVLFKAKSLIDGKETWCDPYSCVVGIIDQTETNELIAIYKNSGQKGLMLRFGWSETDIDAFMAEWR